MNVRPGNGRRVPPAGHCALRVTRRYAATPEEVWAAITDADSIGRWLAPAIDVELAAHFPTSRPGVSRHLRVLREQGLVHAREEGQRRLYSLDPAPLAELDAWMGRYRGFWTNRLDALDTEIQRRRRAPD